LRRFFVKEIKATEDGHCRISGPEAKHISRVLRMDKGDRLILMDGRGKRFEAEILSTGRDSVRLFIKRPLPAPRPSPVEITLCPSLLKLRSMDYLIEKTSELGVDRIIPFFSQRTVVRLPGDRAAGRIRHWRAVARSAAKQSDRMKPAEISPPLPFRDLMDGWKKEKVLKIVLWEGEDMTDLRQLLRSRTPAKHFVGLVGPEGGFSGKELKAAGEAGFRSVSVGQRILRAETAAITLVAIVQYEWGDLGLNSKLKN
jgi:16S rRNA (uracil1498-N3)-methyltransferase